MGFVQQSPSQTILRLYGKLQKITKTVAIQRHEW